MSSLASGCDLRRLVLSTTIKLTPSSASKLPPQVIDLGTNSAKAVRAQINTIKIESMTYEIPLVRLGLGGGSGLSSGGRKVEIEWIVRVGSLGVAGKGGIVIEVSFQSFTLSLPLSIRFASIRDASVFLPPARI